MQKLVGSVLILAASTGIGFLKGMDMQKYLKELQDLRQVFLMLRSEIRYTKAPLAEAFLHISRRIEGVYGKWLVSLAGRMEEKSGGMFQDIWKESVENALGKTHLKETDLEQLSLFGRNIGYLDGEMQMGTIDLYLEQLQVEIEQMRDGLAVKKKLCNCLGVMGGIFLVVLIC